MKEMKVNVLLYDGFEALDAFGPVEVLGSMEEFELQYVSLEGGMVKSWQGFQVDTVAIQTVSVAEILLVPGARNVRPLLEDAAFMQVLKEAAEASQYCLTVCTGSALLCKTGLLNGKKATSNKMAFAWVKTLNDLVDWQGCARWTKDGKYYTASGISAGQDMVLGFVAELFGTERALKEAHAIEYVWNQSPENYPFAK